MLGALVSPRRCDVGQLVCWSDQLYCIVLYSTALCIVVFGATAVRRVATTTEPLLCPCIQLSK